MRWCLIFILFIYSGAVTILLEDKTELTEAQVISQVHQYIEGNDYQFCRWAFGAYYDQFGSEQAIPRWNKLHPKDQIPDTMNLKDAMKKVVFGWMKYQVSLNEPKEFKGWKNDLYHMQP